jgi:hypothetical protein
MKAFLANSDLLERIDRFTAYYTFMVHLNVKFSSLH